MKYTFLETKTYVIEADSMGEAQEILYESDASPVDIDVAFVSEE